jgi:hypothetical protein
MNEQIIFERAIKNFGSDKQKIVAIEELAELQKELTKDLRGKVNREIIEEITDVEIMLAQLKIIYGRYFGNREFHRALKDFRREKLKRLADTMCG